MYYYYYYGYPTARNMTPLLEEMTEFTKYLLGENSFDTAAVLHCHGSYLMFVNSQPEKCEKLRSEALQIMEGLNQDFQPWSNFLISLAQFYLDQGRDEECDKLFQRAKRELRMTAYIQNRYVTVNDVRLVQARTKKEEAEDSEEVDVSTIISNNRRKGGAASSSSTSAMWTYVLQLIATPELPMKTYVVVEFENPTDPHSPLYAEQLVTDDNRQNLVLRSKPFPGVEVTSLEEVTPNLEVYIKVFTDSSKEKLLCRLKQLVLAVPSLEDEFIKGHINID